MKVAYLFPDTNLFLQCKPLHELDWSAWREYDEIDILVTRPVRKEIDKHKNTGGNRIARRSRSASSLLRKIIRSSEGFERVPKDGWTIKVMLLQQEPSFELENEFDYTEFDDALVGTVYAFVKNRATGGHSWLLTHDTGPMLTAKGVGVPVFEIPDDWLLDPEPSAETKKLNELEDRLRRLERFEPAIEVFSVDEDGREVDEEYVLELRANRWLPLDETDVARLMSTIRRRFPEETDFEGVKSEQLLAGVALPWAVNEHVPASAEAIEEYRREKYPGWVSRVKAVLESYPNRCRRPSGFRHAPSSPETAGRGRRTTSS